MLVRLTYFDVADHEEEKDFRQKPSIYTLAAICVGEGPYGSIFAVYFYNTRLGWQRRGCIDDWNSGGT